MTQYVLLDYSICFVFFFPSVVIDHFHTNNKRTNSDHMKTFIMIGNFDEIFGEYFIGAGRMLFIAMNTHIFQGIIT
jgi:hypothetical protein